MAMDTITTDTTASQHGKSMQNFDEISPQRDVLDDDFLSDKRGPDDASTDYYDEVDNEGTNYSGSGYYGYSDDSETIGLTRN